MTGFAISTSFYAQNLGEKAAEDVYILVIETCRDYRGLRDIEPLSH